MARQDKDKEIIFFISILPDKNLKSEYCRASQGEDKDKEFFSFVL
jgi:hypothetical protein